MFNVRRPEEEGSERFAQNWVLLLCSGFVHFCVQIGIPDLPSYRGEKTDTEPISGFSFIIIAYWWLQDLHCPAAGRHWSCNRYLNIVAKDDRSARAACFYWIYMLMSCSSAPAAQWQLRHTCEPMNRSVIERLSIQPEMAEFCIQQRSGQERYLHCALMAMKAMTGTHHDCVVDWDFPADIKRWWWSIIELVRQRDFCWLW